MRCTSGLLRSIEYTICLRIVVLPAFGGETIRPRWPFPIGETRSTIRPVISAGRPSSSSRSLESGNSGVRSSNGSAARALRRGHAVDLVDAQQRRVLLVARLRAGEPLHEVALAQRESAHLRRRDVHVLVARQVAVARRKP